MWDGRLTTCGRACGEGIALGRVLYPCGRARAFICAGPNERRHFRSILRFVSSTLAFVTWLQQQSQGSECLSQERFICLHRIAVGCDRCSCFLQRPKGRGIERPHSFTHRISNFASGVWPATTTACASTCRRRCVVDGALHWHLLLMLRIGRGRDLGASLLEQRC